MRRIHRGEVYYATLGKGIGSEQSGTRPVLIVQNDIGNRFSDTVVVVPLTTSKKKRELPTHVKTEEGIILVEQVRTISKQRLKDLYSTLNDSIMKRVDEAMFYNFHGCQA